MNAKHKNKYIVSMLHEQCKLGGWQKYSTQFPPAPQHFYKYAIDTEILAVLLYSSGTGAQTSALQSSFCAWQLYLAGIGIVIYSQLRAAEKADHGVSTKALVVSLCSTLVGGILQTGLSKDGKERLQVNYSPNGNSHMLDVCQDNTGVICSHFCNTLSVQKIALNQLSNF